jgi:poly-gamma-glutamate synthesis protein (capsule biosynthesis protein)
MVLGHHAHILKAVEMYKQKPIFHSLCNFAFDLHLPEEEWNNPVRRERLAKLNPTWTLDPAYKAYPFPTDSRKSVMVRIVINNRRVESVSMQPVLVNEDSQPRCLTQADPEFAETVDYMRRITADQNIATQYRVAENEIFCS